MDKTTAERWERQFQLLSTILDMNEQKLRTTIKDITELLKEIEPNIDINTVNSSIRHYRKNGLLKRKHNPYKRPFEYTLSKKGIKQLEWLEDFAVELLLDIDN